MLQALKFVQGAIAKKDLVSSLTHFRISNNRIKSFNGKIGLCSPIDIDITATPKAVPMVKAIQTCSDETVAMYLTKANRLAIKSGPFKAFVECTEDEVPDQEPEGDFLPVESSELLTAIKRLSPYISEDASRPWSRGILFRGHSLIATNNIIIVEHWVPEAFPVVINVPQVAIQELLRIGETPTGIQVSDRSITFHFEGERWLKSILYDLSWPDIDKILDVENNAEPVPPGFWDCLDRLTAFTDDLERVFFKPGKITTAVEEETGASVAFEGLPDKGCYNIKQLKLLESIVKKIDLSRHPQPCIFYGERLRGAIIGMRDI